MTAQALTKVVRSDASLSPCIGISEFVKRLGLDGSTSYGDELLDHLRVEDRRTFVVECAVKRAGSSAGKGEVGRVDRSCPFLGDAVCYVRCPQGAASSTDCDVLLRPRADGAWLGGMRLFSRITKRARQVKAGIDRGMSTDCSRRVGSRVRTYKPRRVGTIFDTVGVWR